MIRVLILLVARKSRKIFGERVRKESILQVEEGSHTGDSQVPVE